MATKEPTSIAASDVPSSRGRVPPSEEPRARTSKSTKSFSSNVGCLTEPKSGRAKKKSAGKDARAPIESSTGTRNRKTATPTQSTEIQPATGPNGYPVHSTSKLGELFDLNRATVAQRLKERKIKPVDVGPRKADYELTPQVEEILSDGVTDPEFKAAQRRIAIANARIKEKEADEAEKRSVPRDEMFEEVSGILKSLYQAFALQMPRANRAKYAKITSATEMEKALKADNTKPFLQLRNNYNEIFEQRSASQKPDRNGGRK